MKQPINETGRSIATRNSTPASGELHGTPSAISHRRHGTGASQRGSICNSAVGLEEVVGVGLDVHREISPTLVVDNA